MTENVIQISGLLPNIFLNEIFVKTKLGSITWNAVSLVNINTTLNLSTGQCKVWLNKVSNVYNVDIYDSSNNLLFSSNSDVYPIISQLFSIANNSISPIFSLAPMQNFARTFGKPHGVLVNTPTVMSGGILTQWRYFGGCICDGTAIEYVLTGGIVVNGSAIIA